MTALFRRTWPQTARLVACVLASFGLMVADGPQGRLEPLRAMIATALDPIAHLVELPVRLLGGLGAALRERATLEGRLAELERERLLLVARSQKYAALAAENMRLRELLQASISVGERTLVADVMAVDFEGDGRRVLLNKGTRDEVYPGQPVVDADGVMGQVLHAAAFTSQAMLLTDPAHALPVYVTRTGVRGLAVGTGLGDTLDLNHVPGNADVRVDDLVVTSGLGGRFPAGYPVGRVTRVELDPFAPFARIAVAPSAQLLRSREVLLIWPEHIETPGPETPGPETPTATEPPP